MIDKYSGAIGKVGQDYFRRIVLKELDKDGGLAPEFISNTVRYLLDHDQHVVLEGIFWSQRYGHMLKDLVRDHCGCSWVFYLDVSLPETLRRHQMRPQASEFTADDMRRWFNRLRIRDMFVDLRDPARATKRPF